MLPQSTREDNKCLCVLQIVTVTDINPTFLLFFHVVNVCEDQEVIIAICSCCGYPQKYLDSVLDHEQLGRRSKFRVWEHFNVRVLWGARVSVMTLKNDSAWHA